MGERHLHYVKGGRSGQIIMWDCYGSCSWRAGAPRNPICSGGCEVGVRLLGDGGGE